jgi:hypothetical protein
VIAALLLLCLASSPGASSPDGGVYNPFHDCKKDPDCETGWICTLRDGESIPVCTPGCRPEAPHCPPKYICSEVLPHRCTLPGSNKVIAP